MYLSLPFQAPNVSISSPVPLGLLLLLLGHKEQEAADSNNQHESGQEETFRSKITFQALKPSETCRLLGGGRAQSANSYPTIQPFLEPGNHPILRKLPTLLFPKQDNLPVVMIGKKNSFQRQRGSIQESNTPH